MFPFVPPPGRVAHCYRASRAHRRRLSSATRLSPRRPCRPVAPTTASAATLLGVTAVRVVGTGRDVGHVVAVQVLRAAIRVLVLCDSRETPGDSWNFSGNSG